MHEGGHRKLAAIMFTDMVGYTALTQRNEKLALELLEEHRRVLREWFPKFNGREIETTGDGFLVEFASALEAARCAIEIQRSLATRNIAAQPERQIHVRIGIHVGDVVQKEGKLMGDAVNIAARIEPLAEAGGICLSRPVVDQIANKIDAPLVMLGTPDLKNISVPMEVYRVVLPWRQPPAPPSKILSAPRQSNRTALHALTALSVLLLAGGIWFVIHRGLPPRAGDSGDERAKLRVSAAPGRIESLAVLPLDNFSGDTNKNYFADGLTDELIGKLAQISALRKVTSRTTVMPYRGTKKPVPEIGRELNVDAIVEGSVVLSGARVSIKVQLIEAASDRHIWSNTYEGDTADIIRIQNDVTLAIAQAIRLALTPEDQTRLSRIRPVNPEAYELYLLGKILKGNLDDTDNLKAIESLERAVNLDKGFAPTYAALAAAYIDRLYNFAPQESKKWESKAALRVQQALETDPESADAYVSRAMLNFSPVRNFRIEEAHLDVQRALRLNSKLSDAHLWLGVVYGHTGLLDEALAAVGTVLALDPAATTPFADKACVQLWKGDYESALPLWSKIPRGMGGPYFIGSHAAWTLFALQRTNDAKAILEEFRKDFPKDETGELAAMNAVLLAAAGDVAGAEAQIESAKKKKTGYGEFHHTAYFLASAYARLNRPAEAVQWLNDAATTGFPCYHLFKNDPGLDKIRTNPGFVSFLQGQEKEWRRRKEAWLKAEPSEVKRTSK